MNREILFRAKRKYDDEWTYGDLEHNGKGEMKWVNGDEVIPETVGQYIGLTDKNGEKIFEGDIVRVTVGIYGYKSTYNSYVEEVKFYNNGMAVFLPFSNSDIVEVEIIGNIYDNPELLRSENE